MEQQQGAVGGGEEVIVVLEVENGTNGHNVTLHEPTEEELRHSVMIFYIVLFVMIGAQSALVRWRRSHKRSYDLVTLIGLWLVPPIISVQLFFWRFLLVCTCMCACMPCIATCFVTSQCGVNEGLGSILCGNRILSI